MPLDEFGQPYVDMNERLTALEEIVMQLNQQIQQIIQLLTKIVKKL